MASGNDAFHQISRCFCFDFSITTHKRLFFGRHTKDIASAV